jgi:hypothetical protein
MIGVIIFSSFLVANKLDCTVCEDCCYDDKGQCYTFDECMEFRKVIKMGILNPSSWWQGLKATIWWSFSVTATITLSIIFGIIIRYYGFGMLSKNSDNL